MAENTDATMSITPDFLQSNWRQDFIKGKIQERIDSAPQLQKATLDIKALQQIGSQNLDEMMRGILALTDFFTSTSAAIGTPLSPEQAQTFTGVLTASIVESSKPKQ